MATFAFSGRTRGGENVSGERIGDTMDAVVAALRREQISGDADPAGAGQAGAAAAVKKLKARRRARRRTWRSSRASSR